MFQMVAKWKFLFRSPVKRDQVQGSGPSPSFPTWIRRRVIEPPKMAFRAVGNGVHCDTRRASQGLTHLTGENPFP